MNGSMLLAWRELTARRRSFVLSVAAVAVVIALCTTLELVSRAREVAVASRIDFKGPALRIIPGGLSQIDLERFRLGTSYLPEGTASFIEKKLSRSVRNMESRHLRVEEVGGKSVHVIGFDPGDIVTPFDALKQLPGGSVVLGSQLARTLHTDAGETIPLLGGEWPVAAVLPSTGTVEDLALFLRRADLREEGIAAEANEIRLFLRPGQTIDGPLTLLQDTRPDLSVIPSNPPGEVERRVFGGLGENRMILYMVAAFVAALSILFWSYLNSTERRIEISTVIATGGTPVGVFSTLALRSVITGVLGAILGYGSGVILVFLQDREAASGILWSPGLFVQVLAIVLVLSIAGSLPVALRSAFRDHVSTLQES